MEVDPARVIADLRELDRLTGGPGGARRLCWTDGWVRAREFLRDRLSAIDGVSVDVDEAGNLWATLPGAGRETDDEKSDGPAPGGARGGGSASDGTVAVGSHLDSVPNGGWLDGALGVMAALEVLRVAASDPPRHPLTLVDFADEEGARFGRSLFGSAAVAGTLDVSAVESLRDAEGDALRPVLAEHGVDLDRLGAATARREGVIAYLELHIEQGPVLESEGVAVAAVSGTAGLERHRLLFEGQASHAGTTPMAMRRDAALAAARDRAGGRGDRPPSRRRRAPAVSCGSSPASPPPWRAAPSWWSTYATPKPSRWPDARGDPGRGRRRGGRARLRAARVRDLPYRADPVRRAPGRRRARGRRQRPRAGQRGAPRRRRDGAPRPGGHDLRSLDRRAQPRQGGGHARGGPRRGDQPPSAGSP